MTARTLIARLRGDDAGKAGIDVEIANLVYGPQTPFSPSSGWLRLASGRPTKSLDAAVLIFKYIPPHIPSDPIEVCVLALEQYV